VIEVAIQNAFCLEIHQNKLFFKKKLLLISSHQNDTKIYKKNYFKQKKNQNF
jgi:hypothetical protein